MESIKIVFAILMIQNGSTIEMVPTDGLSDCLKQKRIIARNIGEEQQGIYTVPGRVSEERPRTARNMHCSWMFLWGKSENSKESALTHVRISI